MNEVVLSEEQIARIVFAVKNHTCRFSQDEAQAMHRFAQTMANGGWTKFDSVLDFGATLIQARKAGIVAVVGVVVVGLLGVIWAGLTQKIWWGR